MTEVIVGAILVAALLIVAIGTAALVSWLNRRDQRRYVKHYVAITGELPPRH